MIGVRRVACRACDAGRLASSACARALRPATRSRKPAVVWHAAQAPAARARRGIRARHARRAPLLDVHVARRCVVAGRAHVAAQHELAAFRLGQRARSVTRGAAHAAEPAQRLRQVLPARRGEPGEAELRRTHRESLRRAGRVLRARGNPACSRPRRCGASERPLQRDAHRALARRLGDGRVAFGRPQSYGVLSCQSRLHDERSGRRARAPSDLAHRA